jgi:MATE family multidrug resistance protein
MSRFGAAALAAHQICLGISSVTFMVPTAIGQASTVRVGFHLGAGDPGLARQAGFLSLGLGIAFMALAAACLRLSAAPIIHLFISSDDPLLPAILTMGKQLIALAALFQIFDGAQAVAAGALRGLRDTRVPLLAALLGYWGIGLPLGVLLAFFLKWGPTGLWWGFVAGLALVSSLLCWRFSLKSKARRQERDGPDYQHDGPQIHLAVPDQAGQEQRHLIGE